MQIVCLGVALLLSVVPMFSQAANGRISGTVKDQTGGTVAGAMVTVTDVARGLARNLTTDDAGVYLAPNLIPGAYTVRVTFTGFQAWERTNITLEVGGDLAVDAVLVPGAQTQTVTITEDVPLVNTTSATLGGTLSNATIVDLPLNGRNYMNLLALQPGTVILNGGAERQSTNGTRTTDSTYLIEGLANDEPYNGRSMVNNSALAGDVTTILPMDSIQEFGNSANNKAEYGLGSGGVVNVGIKTGTNTLHGTAFAFGRGTSFNAKDFFNTPAYNGCPLSEVNGACPLTPLSLEQWGGTAGGPIKKDKLFWFAGFEEQLYTVGQNLPSTTPVVCGGGTPGCGLTAFNQKQSFTDALTALVNAGYTVGPVACAKSPLGGGCPVGASIAANSLLIAGCPANPTVGNSTCTGGLFPANMGLNGNGVNFQPNLLSNNKSDSGVSKISYRMNDRNSFDGMFFIGNGNSLFNDSASESRAQWESLVSARTMLINGAWTWTPTSNLVNELRAGLAYSSAHYDSNDKTIPVTNYVSPSDGNNYSLNTGVTNSLFTGFPIVSIAGFGLRLGGSWPKYQGPDNELQFLDHISVLRGNHAIKFGGEINRLQSNGGVTSNSRGNIPFGASATGLVDFFTGVVGSAGASVLSGNPFRTVHNYQFGLFLQDDWRIKPRVTVNLGLRYQYNTVLAAQTGAYDQFGNFIPNVGPVQVGSPGLNKPYSPDYKDFSPRLGIVWDMFGDGKTVLSAGGSLIYSQIPYIAFLAIGNGVGLGTECTGCAIQIASNGQNAAGVTNTVAGPGNIAVNQASGLATGVLNWNTSTLANGVTILPATAVGGAVPLTCGDGLPKNTVVNGVKLTAADATTCNQPGTSTNLRSPYVSTWNLGIQRALTNSISLHVAYVGTHGTGLLQNLDQNQAPLGAGWIGTGPAGGATLLSQCYAATAPSVVVVQGTGATCQPSSSSAAEQINRPYTISCPAPIGQGSGTNPCLPEWRVNNILSNVGFSNYDGLQMALTARPTHGISTNVAYTWSHALDTGSSNNSVVLIGNTANVKQLNYGPSDFDYRQVLNISTTYQVPDPKLSSHFVEPIVSGWSLNSIITLRGGAPWGPSSGDFSGNGDATGYWNFFGNPNDFRTTGPRNAAQDLNYFLPGTAATVTAPGAAPASAYAINNSACTTLAASEIGPTAYTDAAGTTPMAANAAGAVAHQTSGMLSLENLGCYVQNGSVLLPPAYGTFPQGNRGLFRGPSFEIWDFSLTKNTKITERISTQFRAEFFNVLNHPTFGNPSGNPTNTLFATPGSAPGQFGSANQTADNFQQSPVVGAGGARSMQLGLKIIF